MIAVVIYDVYFLFKISDVQLVSPKNYDSIVCQVLQNCSMGAIALDLDVDVIEGCIILKLQLIHDNNNNNNNPQVFYSQ